MVTASYRPEKSWHLFRSSVRGSDSSFSIDGWYIASGGGLQAMYTGGPRVGLFADDASITVQSFRVLTP